jgi:hypothetical protein
MPFGFWRADAARERRAARDEPGATGNRLSGDHPIAAVWPEHGQRAFGAFLERLGGAKDKAEFDRFIAERRV